MSMQHWTWWERTFTLKSGPNFAGDSKVINDILSVLESWVKYIVLFSESVLLLEWENLYLYGSWNVPVLETKTEVTSFPTPQVSRKSRC